VKYDKKTGEKKPECRMDEIKLSLEQLSNLQKQSNGLIDREFENNLLLKDISVSLGLVVDILGTLYNRMFYQDKEQPKQ
jgi:hypothetical protein